ncbi:MAG: hypothetical protein OEY78_04480 [Gammaproteobacteria bacterium]|nr:hypothetical protein [Gammaproteobacteria bacterium]
MKIYKTTGNLFLTFILINLLAGCSGPNPRNMTTMSPAMNAKKEMQTSRFNNLSEQDLHHQTINLVQDLGFQIIYANAALGIITGEKPGNLGLHFSESMGEAFAFGRAEQPAFPYRFGIIATTRPAMTGFNEYLLRIKVMRVWRAGSLQKIVFVNDFENASLYQKIFARLPK